MKQFSTCFASLAFSSLLYSQSLPNPSFESNGAFDMTGWDWFCNTPDFAAGPAHSGCCGLLLPTSDAFSPCFSTGQAIGVHTKIDDMEAGVPYTLTLWESMSGPDITSDVGMFAMPAGQVPTSFGGVPLNTWPIGLGSPGGWFQDVLPFTIPAQYAGMDFYFFIEYSIAPDPIPGAKMFDDISFTDVSTGIAEANSPTGGHTCPVVTDVLRLGISGQPAMVEIFGIDGRFVSNKVPLAGSIDVSELACGTYLARNGPLTQRFTKE